MNFRDLFTKLDGIVNEYQDPVTGAGIRGLQPRNQQTPNQVPTPNPEQTQPDQKPTIPGQQPSLGPKPTPQEVQAVQYPNQKPAPAPAVVTDPKADITAMAQALKAVAGQPAAPQMQPTSSGSVAQQQQQANGPKTIDAPLPGEPMEEEIVSEISRAEKNRLEREAEAKKADGLAGKDKAKAEWLAAIQRDPKLFYSKDLDPALKREIWSDVKSTSPDTHSAILALSKKSEEPKASAQEEPGSKKPAEAPAAAPAKPAEAPAVDPNAAKPADGKKDDNSGAPPAAEPEKKEQETPKKREWAKGVLGKGMTGTQVQDLQAELNRMGFKGADGNALSTDGVFGPNTEHAVKQLQQKLGVKDDGAYGNITKAALAKNPINPVSPVASEKGKEKEVAQNPVDTLAAQRDLIANAEKQAADLQAAKQAVADDEFKTKYKDVDRNTLLRQTGNMKKSHLDLKQGDVDYDDRGVKHVYQPGVGGGPGEWKASWDSIGDWQKEPGMGLVGPSASSPEGKAYLDARKARVLTPQQSKDYDRLFPQQAAPAPAAAAPTKVQSAAQEGDAKDIIAQSMANGLNVSDALRQAGAKQSTDASGKVVNTMESMSAQLRSLADEFLNETKQG